MQRRASSKSLMLSGRGSSAVMKPQLTSLIDVMTILLVFLLNSFSAEGNFISVSPDMKLSQSASDKAPVPALNVEITPENIVVDGHAVMEIKTVETSDSLMLDPLYAGLENAVALRQAQGDEGQIIIQCDRTVDFKVLKKIMYTCGKAKFSNFSLLVVEKA